MRNGIHTGFSGHINLVAGRDLVVEAGKNAWSITPSDLNNVGMTVHGAFAAVGHGGYMLGTPSRGDIRVTVGRDALVKGQEPEDPFGTELNNGYTILGDTAGDGLQYVASAFNFAKIGHIAVENRDKQANRRVTDVTHTGDIVVAVGRDLNIQGGATSDAETLPAFGAFAQIGHGGPGVSTVFTGLSGEIVVQVGRDLEVLRGTQQPNADGKAFNNYAMIGHGDHLQVEANPLRSLFNGSATGTRRGNIQVLTGRHANFDGALVGHLDLDARGAGNIRTFGNTQIAVSRNMPFYGGQGTLTATNGTVFSSGSGGQGSRLQLFMPGRSSNRMDSTTRLNSGAADGGFLEAEDDFEGLVGDTKLAGRSDEVYLTPDLWWDNQGLAAGAGWTTGSGFPGGAIAEVDSPGGLPNLVGLSPGELGSSADVYRNNNGVSGTGRYTLYYDAIEFVDMSVPSPPPPPPYVYPGFDFYDYQFWYQFDSFFRSRDGYDYDYEGELYGSMALYESNERGQSRLGPWRLENALDSLFGARWETYSNEELDEEERRKRERGNRKVGPMGLVYYSYYPGTNRYSSYQVFGYPQSLLYPAQ